MNGRIPTYLVTLKITQEGDSPLAEHTGTIEVPSFMGGDAAGRRAKWSAIASGWGDVDEVEVQSVELIALRARA